MAKPQRVAGTLFLLLDGERLSAAGDFTYRPSVPQREILDSPDGDVHYSESLPPGFIEGELRNVSELDLVKLANGINQTVELDIGTKRILGRDMFFAGEATATTAEGKVPVKWVGNVEELT